jgi:hypothetical protein
MIGEFLRTEINIPRPFFPPARPDLKRTLLLSCGTGFDQNIQNAATHIMEGYARGWSEECGPAKLVHIVKLIDEIKRQDDPVIFVSQSFVHELTEKELKQLRDFDVFMWVYPHHGKYGEFEKKIQCRLGENDRKIVNDFDKILLAEPKFVCAPVGEASLEFYHGWRDDGFHWETLHLAADGSRYYPDPAPDKYGDIKMAYVGGYWGEKARAFDMYLRPWEDIIVPFGYQQWPYKNYGGGIDEPDERRLYSSAGLIPLVTSPAGWVMAEITERYFKAPACKAFCIADQNPALREIFTEDEMLRAESPEQFHELVRDYLAGKIDSEGWREKAYKAVQERHLYNHRALQIKEAFEKLR